MRLDLISQQELSREFSRIEAKFDAAPDVSSNPRFQQAEIPKRIGDALKVLDDYRDLLVKNSSEVEDFIAKATQILGVINDRLDIIDGEVPKSLDTLVIESDDCPSESSSPIPGKDSLIDDYLEAALLISNGTSIGVVGKTVEQLETEVAGILSDTAKMFDRRVEHEFKPRSDSGDFFILRTVPENNRDALLDLFLKRLESLILQMLQDYDHCYQDEIYALAPDCLELNLDDYLVYFANQHFRAIRKGVRYKYFGVSQAIASLLDIDNFQNYSGNIVKGGVEYQGVVLQNIDGRKSNTVVEVALRILVRRRLEMGCPKKHLPETILGNKLNPGLYRLILSLE